MTTPASDHPRRWILLGLASFLWLATSDAGAQTAVDLRVLDEIPAIIVEGPTSTGQAWFHVRNDGRSEARLMVTVGTFVSQLTHRAQAAQTTFFKGTDTTGVPFLDTTLTAGATLPIKIQVSNLREAGESVADLFINGTPRSIRAVHDDVAFAVSVVAATPDRPRIVVKSDASGTFVLKNDDPVAYSIAWRLFLVDEGTAVEGVVLLQPKSSVPITISGPPGWFSGWFGALFKADQRSGFLTLQMKPTGPVKTLPADVSLTYWSDTMMTVAGSAVLFGVLLLGGACSMVVALWIPNQLARVGLINRLEDVANKTRGISSATESTLRVGVRVERLRLWETLYALGTLGTLSPEGADRLKQLDRDVDTLRKRVDLVDELDEVTRRLAALRIQTSGAPPTLLKRIARGLEDATRLLKQSVPTDADLQTAQTAIKAADARLDKIQQEDQAFAKELAAQVAGLRKSFLDGPITTMAKYKELQPRLGGLLDVLDPELEKENNVTPEKYHWIDISVGKILIVRHYILRVEDNAGDPERQKLILEREGPLFKLLRLQSAEALELADRIKKQIEDNVFVEDLRVAITQRRFRIHREPQTPYPNTPVRLWVEFNEPAYRDRAAQRDLRCLWKFGANIGDEQGWEIVHYFREGKDTLTVSFETPDGNPIVDANREPITLTDKVPLQTARGQRRDRATLEGLRMLFALGLAVVALLSGARDQLLKLDIVPGLIAVFLVGFGADSIKNLFTRR